MVFEARSRSLFEELSFCDFFRENDENNLIDIIFRQSVFIVFLFYRKVCEMISSVQAIHAGNHAKIQQMAPKNHKADCRRL